MGDGLGGLDRGAGRPARVQPAAGVRRSSGWRVRRAARRRLRGRRAPVLALQPPALPARRLRGVAWGGGARARPGGAGPRGGAPGPARPDRSALPLQWAAVDQRADGDRSRRRPPHVSAAGGLLPPQRAARGRGRDPAGRGAGDGPLLPGDRDGALRVAARERRSAGLRLRRVPGPAPHPPAAGRERGAPRHPAPRRGRDGARGGTLRRVVRPLARPQPGRPRRGDSTRHRRRAGQRGAAPRHPLRPRGGRPVAAQGGPVRGGAAVSANRRPRPAPPEPPTPPEPPEPLAPPAQPTMQCDSRTMRIAASTDGAWRASRR